MAMKKDAKDHIPFCQDQGIPNLVGTKSPGKSIQGLTYTMVLGGVVDFEANGLSKMDVSDGKYQVIIQNHTDVGDEAAVAEADKLGHQFTITGPDADDVLDILIFGRLAGQTG
jgi:tartrate dehydratase alpha subunit/fumarate hydratase class I-like protein